jgi:hypothetical protein
MLFIRKYFRGILYVISFSISSIVLFHFTPINSFDRKLLLDLLVSVNSVIVAITVAYLFSKLFSEKAIRVERKKEIDDLSKKITLLRRIAFRIRKMHDFWRYRDKDLKAIIDRKYPDLTYEEYRGIKGPQWRVLDYEEMVRIGEEIYGTDGQAYLALKGMEDSDDEYSFYVEFNPKNYSAEEISRYIDYSRSFMYFLENGDRVHYDFARVNRYHLDILADLYFKITGRNIDDSNFRKSLSDLFNSFEEVFFRKHYYLSRMNADVFPKVFRINFFNLLVFLVLLLSSIFLFTIDLSEVLGYRGTLFILSLFVSNAIDLIAITFVSIRSELDVNDIFKI